MGVEDSRGDFAADAFGLTGFGAVVGGRWRLCVEVVGAVVERETGS